MITDSRQKVGTLVSENKLVTEKRDKYQGLIGKGEKAFGDAKAQLASEGLVTTSSIASNVKKKIGENIDFIMGSKTIRSLVKSIVMTFSRVKTEDILKKTDNEDQKNDWAAMIKEMKLTRAESDTLRVSPENLTKIENKLDTLKESGKTDKKTRSEILLCQILIKEYRPRIEIKRNYNEVFQAGSVVGARALADLTHADFESPQTLMLKMVFACKDDPTLRGHLNDMVSNPDNPLRKVLVAAEGEVAVHGLKLALSDDGLAIATALIKVGSPEMASSFLRDPVGTFMDNREKLGAAAAEVCDHFVAMLSKPELAETVVAMSEGKLQLADVAMLKELIPLAKELVSELVQQSERPISSEPGTPSKKAVLVAKMAEQIAIRCDVELAKLSSSGAEPLPVGKAVTSLASSLNSSVSFLVSKTMGTPDAIVLSTEGNGNSTASLSDIDHSEQHSDLEVAVDHSTADESKAGGWGSWFVSVAGQARQLGVGVVGATLGEGAADYVNGTIDTAVSKTAAAATYVAETASLVQEVVVDAASTIRDVAVSIKDGAVDYATDKAVGFVASTVAGQIDTQVGKMLNTSVGGVAKTKAPGVQLALNTDKLTELMAQSVGMLSHFVAENPAVLDTIGQSGMALVGTAADILQDPTMDRSDRATALAAALEGNVGKIGESIRATGGPNSELVGQTLMDVSRLLGSDLVQRSLEQATVLSSDTVSQASHFATDKFKFEVTSNVSKTLDKLAAPKLAKLDTGGGHSDFSVTVPKVAAELLHADRSAMSLGGMVGAVLRFVGPEFVKEGLNLALQLPVERQLPVA